MVLDALAMEQPRTKEMNAFLGRLNVGTTALILLSDRNDNVELSARNLSNVKTIMPSCLSVRDLLNYDYLLADREAVTLVQDWLGAAS